MEQASMSAYRAQVEKYGTPITGGQFKELRAYANEHRIQLSGFKDYVGDISTIKTVIDDIVEISHDFPLILDGKKSIWLNLDYHLGSDFAKAEDHIIYLNGGYFGNLEQLEQEYDIAVKAGRFVRGTDWRAIARHETGHVVANLYHINPMKIAMEILDTKSRIFVMEYLKQNLSKYSVELVDGKEIISECFSAYYSKVENKFADNFLSRCREVRL